MYNYRDNRSLIIWQLVRQKNQSTHRNMTSSFEATIETNLMEKTDC
jgi:hypothetical protein